MTAARRSVTPAEYLALERAAEHKCEYADGYIFAMSGASREHNLIAINTSAELRQQLKERPCEAYGSDMRVQISAVGQYRYPDISIVCEEPLFADAELDTLLNPTVLIEILSPSTERIDRTDKFDAYTRLPSLREYILIAQDQPLVEHYRRDGDRWVLTTFGDLNDTVALPAIGCTLALREVYAKVRFAAGGPATQSVNDAR